MARRRHVISNMPLRNGVTTAGQQGTIPETALWRAENCAVALDGMIVKRPGLTQWGQTIRQPRRFDAVSFYEMFETVDSWRDDDGSDQITYVANRNKMNVQVLNVVAGATSQVVGRVPTGTQSDSDNDDWSVRFTVATVNMDTDDYFEFSCKARVADDPYQFRVTGETVQYNHSVDGWTDFALDGVDVSYDFYETGPTVIELRFDADGNAELYINDTQVGEAAVSDMSAGPAFTEGTYIEFTFYSRALGAGDYIPYNLYITDLMFEGAVVRPVDEDGDPLTDDVPYEPFATTRLGAGTDFKSIIGGTAVQRNLLVASNKYVYRDAGMSKMWSPLLKLTGGNVTFCPFHDDLIIFDADNGYSSKAYRWNGMRVPEWLDDAPPVRFGSEHRTRLLAAGDKRFPLRVYYTASRDPKVWFAPLVDADGQETESEVLDAGYVQVPGKRGDEVIAIYGEFYGSCIICTNRGIWRLTGSSPTSFALENISQDTGATSFAGLARMGNDLWIAGRQGITTIQTVQQFGDMKSSMPSAPIGDLWAPGTSNSSLEVDQYQMYLTSMSWNPTLSLLYFAFARQGASDVSSIYAYHPVTQAWYGPWSSDTTFVADVEIASPILQATMHGTAGGKVGITDANLKADFGEAYTMTI